MMKIHSVDQGFCRIVYRTINPQNQVIYYAIQKESPTGYQIYRLCQKLEPSHKAYARIPLDELFELPTGDSRLEISIRNIILGHAQGYYRK